MTPGRQGWRRITLLAIGYGLGFVSGGVSAWLAFAHTDHAAIARARPVYFMVEGVR